LLVFVMVVVVTRKWGVWGRKVDGGGAMMRSIGEMMPDRRERVL
jgi:hypothetical protein